ncbi:helix-turn-helix domain-containing protein [Micromonospora sp. 4G55]|uniref:helix-turn-helix domain-containing protein n=1 Tax=Micromonospora sp. 4G55 TaxID=2806102 RepID=UPI001A42DD77|nr:helix-turn-helix domain-containing protein [Micromonospora sp. 4G55]
MQGAIGLDDRWQQLGRQLARLRTLAGYTQHSLAPLLHYGRSTVANVEVGRQRPPRRFWERCDEVLGTGGQLTAAFDQLQVLRRAAGGTGSASQGFLADRQPARSSPSSWRRTRRCTAGSSSKPPRCSRRAARPWYAPRQVVASA